MITAREIKSLFNERMMHEAEACVYDNTIYNRVRVSGRKSALRLCYRQPVRRAADYKESHLVIQYSYDRYRT